MDRVYLVPDGGLGIVYTLLYCAVLRLFFTGQLVFHHRNYSHINAKSLALAQMVSWFPGRLLHVFLEDRMGADFEAVYGRVTTRMTVGNAAMCDANLERVADKAEAAPVTLSFLSYLTDEKGFHIIESCFLSLGKRHSDLRFSIAGPAAGPTASNGAQKRLENLKTALGNRFTYHGVLLGTEKQAFYARTDLFVFPTIYKLEAQPNVLFEAMAGGCVIVSTRHACIPDMLGSAPHRLIDIGPAIVEECLAAIEAELEVGDWHVRSARAAAAFDEIKTGSTSAYNQLLDRLGGPDHGR